MIDRSIEGVFVCEGHNVWVTVQNDNEVKVQTVFNEGPVHSRITTHQQAANEVDKLIQLGYVRYG